MVRGYTGVWCTGGYWSILPPTPLPPPCSGGIPSASMPRISVLKSVKENNSLVRDGNEAGVELVLIQPYLLSYANEVVFNANSFSSSKISIRRQWRFESKQSQSQSHIHSKAVALSPQLKNGLLSF